MAADIHNMQDKAVNTEKADWTDMANVQGMLDIAVKIVKAV